MKLSLFTCACALAAIVLSASAASAAPALTIISPGTGYTGVDIWGVSGDGKYILGDQQNTGIFRATRWTVANSAATDLGLLTGFPYSEGEYLDFNGGIAAANAISSTFTPKTYQWTAPSTQTVLPFIPGGTFLYAEGISSDGSVIAGWGNTTSAQTPQRLTRWTTSGIVVIPLPSDTAYSSAIPDLQASKILSGNGQFIIGNTNDVAFRYNNSTGITSDIGQMQTGKFPRLTSISNDGSEIIGYSPFQFPDQINGQAGFLWTSSGGFASLGTLTGTEGDTVIPRFLSGDGKTVLGTDMGINFIWTQQTGMMSFSNYLASLGIDMSNLQDVSFSGISDDGATIAGRAETSTNALVGWVVSVPEPASLAFAACAVPLLLRRRAR